MREVFEMENEEVKKQTEEIVEDKAKIRLF